MHIKETVGLWTWNFRDLVLKDVKTFYRPAMKLWEGNVFSCVCSSFCPKCRGVLCDHYPCMGPRCTGTPPPPWPQSHPPAHEMDPPVPIPNANDIWWPKLQSCSNLFICEHPRQCWYLVAIEAHTFGTSPSYWNTFLLQLRSLYP